MNFNFLTFSCFIISLILFEVFFFVKINQILKINLFIRIVLYFIFYCFQTIVFILILHFLIGKNLIYLIFSNVDKSVIVQDPQDYLIVLWQSGLMLSGLISVIQFTFYFHFLFSGIFRKEEFVVYKTFLIFLYYSLLISLVIFFMDILFYHWEIFYPEKMFDFQPDLLLWFFHYKDEYKDVLILFLIIFSLYLIFFLSSYISLFVIHNNIFIRLIPFFIFVSYSLYLFGGESLFRDLWLLICSFISAEFFIFSKIAFEIFKRYKGNIIS